MRTAPSGHLALHLAQHAFQVDNLDSNAYVPPASNNTPLAGVTTALYCRSAKMFFKAPVNVAATRSGATYLQRQESIIG